MCIKTPITYVVVGTIIERQIKQKRLMKHFIKRFFIWMKWLNQ